MHTDPRAADGASLAQLLRGAGWIDPVVSVTEVASGGAQRSTLMLRIEHAGGTTDAVAQVNNSAISPGSAVDEAALLALAVEAGVPVPRVLAATDSLAGSGNPAMIVSSVGGVSIPRHVLRSLADPDAGEVVTRECADALARLHALDSERAPASLERAEPSAVFGLYCDHLAERLDELDAPAPAVRLGINWLRRHEPAPPDRTSIVHGDFRNGNLLIDEGHLAAVLDWELAHIGDPIEDLAYLCLRTWRFGNDDRPVGGFGTIDTLRSAYELAAGAWRDDAFHWWSVARTAWWATGLAAQAAAFQRGEADSIVLAASGRRVPELEYDLLRLIAPPTKEGPRELRHSR